MRPEELETPGLGRLGFWSFDAPPGKRVMFRDPPVVLPCIPTWVLNVIEHVMLRCRNLKKSRAFYERALEPLGYRATQVYPDAVGFKADGHTSFWLAKGKVGTPTHIAFRAKSRKTVEAFHRVALEAGARDHGAPGLRTDYSPTYYAAFVLDPDGHNMEAVTFVRGRARRRRTAS